MTGIFYDLSSLDPNMAQVLAEHLMSSHPMEATIPLESRVRPILSAEKIAEKMRASGYGIHEAAGIAQILLTQDSTLIGWSDLQDEDGVVRPFASLMDPTGCLFVFRYDEIAIR